MHHNKIYDFTTPTVYSSLNINYQQFIKLPIFSLNNKSLAKHVTY